MSLYDAEEVLRDLLLELGVEGVTLWHIRAVAALVRQRGSLLPWHSSTRLRLNSDLRGEEAVLRDALNYDAERTARMRAKIAGVTRNTSLRAATQHGAGAELHGAPVVEVVEHDDVDLNDQFGS